MRDFSFPLSASKVICTWKSFVISAFRGGSVYQPCYLALAPQMTIVACVVNKKFTKLTYLSGVIEPEREPLNTVLHKANEINKYWRRTRTGHEIELN